MEKININFLNELFLLCFNKKDVINIVTEHFKYQYIPDKLSAYKKVLKSIITTYKNTGRLPTVGIISQQHTNDIKVQEVLSEIKDTSFPDKELILATFDDYIKRSMFIELNEKLRGLYNEGKEKEAISLQAKESEKIVNFTIKQSESYFSRVYGDFNKRMIDKRKNESETGSFNDKVKFGIDPLDVATYGGIDVTDTVLWILRSGIGKSTALKWHGIQATRQRKNVLHIQLEGSKEECEDKYDQIWTASLYNDIKKGNINENDEEIQKIIKKMNQVGSDIFIHAFEKFNTANMIDVRNLVMDFEKIQGHVDLIIIDYLKYLHPGDGVKYGVSIQDVKMKKENTSDRIKNLATELGTRIITADQASDVAKEIWNDPNQVLTRHNISGAKNLPDSYSYVFTGNQTIDELNHKDSKGNSCPLLRIHVEKFRNYKLLDKPISIVTNYDRGRFYDYNRTKEKYYNLAKGRYEY